MISIIISSANHQLLTAVSKNIAETIAVPFEIIAFNNAGGKESICEIYNRGIKQAQYDLLCFMHEDLIIHAKEWGKTVLDIFSENPDLGVLGVAGSFYKPITPSGWSGHGIVTECSNLIQAYKFKNKEPHLHCLNPYETRLAEVVCVDGLWFCVPKAVAEKYKFDAMTFKGFHCYDLDYCLAVGQHYKIAVTYDVLLTHLSEGRFDKTWLLEIFKLHKKWDWILPVNKSQFSRKQTLHIEKVTFRYFLSQLIEFKLPLSAAFKVVWGNSFLNKLGLKFFLKFNFYILKKYIKK